MGDSIHSMKLYGLLGRNISYSLSPAMHNAAFKHFGIPAEYKIFNKNPEEVKNFLETEVFEGHISGINITVPYKVTTKQILSDFKKKEAVFDKWAKLTGAINTIKVTNNILHAYNTDCPGFGLSLQEDAKYSFPPNYQQEKNIFIAGAGGAGRAVMAYLCTTMMNVTFYIYDTAQQQLADIKNVFREWWGQKTSNSIEVISESNNLTDVVDRCELIVNATPLGTKEGDSSPVPVNALKKGMTVYDLVYARETELVKAAREKGLKAATGKGMLVNQGALAFEKWTGKPLAEIKPVMRKALAEALGRR